jgi:hypothetical protein
MVDPIKPFGRLWRSGYELPVADEAADGSAELMAG